MKDQTYQLTQHYVYQRDSNAYTGQCSAITWQESEGFAAHLRWAKAEADRAGWDEFVAGIFGGRLI